MARLPMRISIPPGTPLLARLRVAWAVSRFLVRFSRASEAEQERVLTFLEAQPGVTVTRTEERF